jgi:N-acetylglucosamine kinase-like BadF-type ATPase
MLVAGVDGGQSSTTAVVMNERATVLGYGRAGPSDYVDEPPTSRRCADACETAVAQALLAAGCDAATQLDAVVVGLSGYEGELHGVAPRFATQQVRFVHDAPIALAGATAKRPAVVVIAGTGSIAYGEETNGTSVQIGGYGYLFGDEGSGFAVGRAALAQAMAHMDRGAKSRLGDAALPYFNVDDMRALARGFYSRTISRADIAGFARVVFDAARLGDPDAVVLVEGAARDLASLAAAAIDCMGLAHAIVPVAFTGGMAANPDLREHIVAELALIAPRAIVVDAEYEPVVGAARLALADAGITV